LSTEIRYRRLPGRIMGFVRCPSAWIADDHILLVGGSRFSETYQRVYFRDLQALLIRRKRRFVMQWPYVLLAPLLLFLFFGSLSARGYSPVLALVLIIAAVIAFLTLRFGCYLDLATAVGNVPVHSVAFLWTARRFSAIVVPLVTAAQAVPQAEAAHPLGDAARHHTT
jgi:hypothetical protein